MSKAKYKTFGSTKVLLQAILDKRNTGITNEEIRLALNLLLVLLDNKPLYVLADAQRFATDFAKTMGLNYRHIQHLTDFACIRPGDNVVIIHMGPRTAKQKQFYEDSLVELHKLENIQTWRISRW